MHWEYFVLLPLHIPLLHFRSPDYYDFFPAPQVFLLRLSLLPTFIFSCWIAKISHATLLLLPSPFAQYVSRKETTQNTPTITAFQENIIMRCHSKPKDQRTRRWLVDALWLLVIFFFIKSATLSSRNSIYI